MKGESTAKSRRRARSGKREGASEGRKVGGGYIIGGDEDTILKDGDYCGHLEVVGDGEKMVKFFKDTAKTLERSLAPGKPQLELVKAIEQDKIAGSNFDYSVPLTKLCLFGNLAISNPGKIVEWDSATQSIKGSAEANALLKRAAVRQGWEYSADKI